MILQPAPNKYLLKDQNQVRRILERGLEDAIARLMALESAPSNPPGSAPLPVGLWGTAHLIGTGPGLVDWDTTGPIFSLIGPDQAVSHTTVMSRIAEVEAAGIGPLAFPPARGRNHYKRDDSLCSDSSVPMGHFSRTCYEAKVRQFETTAGGNGSLFHEKILDHKVVLLLGDEFNHPNFSGSVDPDDVNWMGNLIKSIWPGAITTVRMASHTLADGWNTSGVLPTNFWTGLDYGWAQRSGQHNSMTHQQYIDDEKNALAPYDVGVILGLNWWNGGLQADLDEVTACWDVNNDGGSVMGYISGTVNNDGGTIYPCAGGLPSNNYRVATSPDWLKRWADVVVNDPDTPIAPIWVLPEGMGAIHETWTVPLAHRADYVDAMDYVINKLATRTNFNGWRAAKPGDPI